ncbi:MAG: D-alanyl-D-alanine carboxypeptidase [Haloplasmataceae bacterium]|nr:D-alanyl-D-alanine carboxypeptidase [Haloplasmataceae bacterium]
MKKKLILLLPIYFLLIMLYVQIEVNAATPNSVAKSAVLMDSTTGRVLFEKDAHDQRPIASISKIMTALLAVENDQLDSVVTISEKATQQVGSSIYMKKGQQFYLKDLIYALMLRSGNDAAWAIAEHVSGNASDFVLLMNEKAKEIGMKNSFFENPSGLDEETQNISTAFDMALLMRYAMNNPLYREINSASVHRAKSIDGMYYVWHNKHRLINSYDYVIAGKTGFTKKAGRTLVSVAKKNNEELIVVTLNCSNDWNDHMSLFTYGFEEYSMKTIIKKGIFEVKGMNDIFYVEENIVYPLSDEEINQYRIIINKEDKKTYLLLTKNDEVVLKREVSIYDKTHRSLNNAFTISDLGLGIMDIIRELFW